MSMEQVRSKPEEVSISIRPAVVSDIPVLLEFEQGVINAERPFDPTLGQGEIRYYDIEELIRSPDALLLVAEAEGTVVATGYARIRDAKPYLQHRHDAYLGFMYVRPEWRGRGINGKIVQGLKDWAAARGVTELRLEVYCDNASAIAAYEKVGFQKHMIEMR